MRFMNQNYILKQKYNIMKYQNFKNDKIFQYSLSLQLSIKHIIYQLTLGATLLNYLVKPITPQASLPPEFPVLRDYSLLPLPSSSGLSCQINIFLQQPLNAQQLNALQIDLYLMFLGTHMHYPIDLPLYYPNLQYAFPKYSILHDFSGMDYNGYQQFYIPMLNLHIHEYECHDYHQELNSQLSKQFSRERLQNFDQMIRFHVLQNCQGIIYKWHFFQIEVIKFVKIVQQWQR